MPRLNRLHVPGACYFVEQRRTGLFLSVDDFNTFLSLLERHAWCRQVSVLGFCLLPESFSLLVQSGRDPIGSMLNYLEAAYVRKTKAKRVGPRSFPRRPHLLLFDP